MFSMIMLKGVLLCMCYQHLVATIVNETAEAIYEVGNHDFFTNFH